MIMNWRFSRSREGNFGAVTFTIQLFQRLRDPHLATASSVHGRYAYYDTVPDLAVMIELLEFDSDKEVQPKHA
ncbi:hypothetical protein ACC721_08075 [Rhizobium ruizarguesonis]|uniref:hypothetical protein n=1 Tax=Rhizobium ruizarguesonis TaxID=2081791 RepID=UPI001FE1A87C|nr:hypothetical protein [Rhizobium ruizarguesonis]